MLDRETIAPLAARVCAAAAARTGGICTGWLEEGDYPRLSFRLEAEGKIVGTASSLWLFSHAIEPASLEADILRRLLHQLAITPEPVRGEPDE